VSVQAAVLVKATEEDAEEVTKRYGLEAGLFSVFRSGDKEGRGTKAKDLLAKYGSAYLITSISLSIVSFALCYVLVDNGVDVPGLLAKVRRRLGGSSVGGGCSESIIVRGRAMAMIVLAACS
jgi:hypothetical protein